MKKLILGFSLCTIALSATANVLTPGFICVSSPNGIDSSLFHSYAYGIGLEEASGAGQFSYGSVSQPGDRVCFNTFTDKTKAPVKVMLDPTDVIVGDDRHEVTCAIPNGYSGVSPSSDANRGTAFYNLINDKDHTLSCQFSHLGLL